MCKSRIVGKTEADLSMNKAHHNLLMITSFRFQSQRWVPATATWLCSWVLWREHSSVTILTSGQMAQNQKGGVAVMKCARRKKWKSRPVGGWKKDEDKEIGTSHSFIQSASIHWAVRKVSDTGKCWGFRDKYVDLALLEINLVAFW